MMRFDPLSQYRGLRREIYILFFGRVVTNLGAMIWPMMTLILSQKMHLDAGSIALLMAVSGVLMLPTNLLGGRLADRYNKKRIIVSCDTVSVGCYLACGILPMGYPTVALMLVAGIFQSMEYPAYNALFADLTATKDRERAYSLEYLGGNLGLVLSPTIAGMLFKDYLWLSFLISAGAIACSTLLIALLVRNITPEPDDSPRSAYQENRQGQSLRQVLRDKPILLLYLGILALYYAAYGQYNYLMPLDMGRVHGETGAMIFGTVSSLNCVVVVVFTPFITRWFTRVRDTQKVLIGQLLVTAGYGLFLLLLGFVPAYYGAMLLFTWGEIFATIAEGPYLSSRIPASHRGRINGVSVVIGTVVSGGFDLLVGHLYDRAGSTLAWTTVLGALGAAVGMTALLIRRDKKVFAKLYEKE
ncbi:MAG: MFS transporter [Acutalibacteraceae bacterium]|jgi:MFS family permease